ncbi:MAG: hypothetical protein HRT44_10645 [Bdellovibrionales bacterium]|nr:hypothetical protein [Bdellovibrionales bacterium]NQZ19699.1 hypothetical protein [Bdellovibrionales bacterium]
MMKLKILFSLLFLLVACGTDTGNPGATPESGEGFDNAIGVIDRPGDEVIPTLVDVICDRFTDCGTSTFKSCKSSLYALDEIDTEIGLPEGAYSSLKEVHNAFTDEALKESPDDFNQCLADIQASSCSDLDFTQQPHPDNNDFAGSSVVIPSSCSNMVME